MPHCSTVLANEGTAAVSMWIFHHAARNKTLFRTGPMYHVLLDPLNRNHSLLDACYFMDSLSATVNHKQRRSVDQLGLTKAVEMPSADMKTWILPGAFLFSLCLTKWTAVVKGKINHNKAKQKKKSPSIYLCLHSDVTAAYCIHSRGVDGLLLHTGLHFPPGWFPR